MPSKAGSGASTILVQAAGMAARDLEKKVAILEGDLYSGVIGNALGVETARPITELLERAPWLEEAEWRRGVASVKGVDLALTDRVRRNPFPLWSEWFKLLDFLALRYEGLLVDLPEVINEATIEVARRANRIFIVCTTEVQSLTLVRQRRRELVTRGIDTGKIEVIVNRWHKTDPAAADLEELLGQTIAALVRNDYRTISRALSSCGFIDRDTDLGKSILALAGRICSGAKPKPGFLERLKARG
jgi:MinD-like ATPase involved in chromosome partitioning or flagellar assembly